MAQQVADAIVEGGGKADPESILEEGREIRRHFAGVLPTESLISSWSWLVCEYVEAARGFEVRWEEMLDRYDEILKRADRM